MAIETVDYGAPHDKGWKTPAFRKYIVTKLEQAIQKTGVQLARTSSELEASVYSKASDQPEYLILIVHLLQYIKELSMESTTPQAYTLPASHIPHDYPFDFTNAAMNDLQNLNL